MKGLNFEKLGFKAGIEIHQQLDTHKLFCECRSNITDMEPVETIERNLRPVAGETGQIDRAALFESMRSKSFVYKCYTEESCLVEADEEPPHDVNGDALEMSILMSRMTNSVIPSEIHFMRKTVIDGSNTSGFQRTAIIGMDGFIDTSFGRVGITNVCLEEEASKIIEKKEDKVVYGLDRLGIPLIEIGTAPDIKSPSHARETAEKIGMMLRATGRVKRGLGTIRQDVNVSISNGARIEIKGMQDLKSMEKTIENEVERQVSLLEILDELNKRSAGVDGEVLDVTLLFQNTKNSMLSDLVEKGKKVYAFKLRGFGGLLKKSVCEGKTFGKELSDYAKPYGVMGFIHTDEDLGKYDLTREFLNLKKEFRYTEKDIVGIVCEEEEKVKKACAAIMDRAEFAIKGIPEETRMARDDFTTSYLRPLPGKSRMYPETDVSPIVVTEDMLEIRIPISLEERKKNFVDMGLSEDLAGQMVRSRYLNLFEQMLEQDVNHARVADILLNTMKDLKRKGIDIAGISNSDLIEMLNNMEKIPNESVPDVLLSMSQGKSWKDAVSSIEVLDEDELDRIIDAHIDKKMIKSEGMTSFNKLMGPVMAEVRGKIDGNLVAKRLKERIKELL